MAKNQPSKKEATGKNSKGGSGKKKSAATSNAVRKPTKADKIVVSKAQINRQRLERDEAYAKKIHNKKAAEKLAKYQPILSPGERMPDWIRGYNTKTGGSRITREEYEALRLSQYQLPNYLPIRDATTGKLKGYYNEVSGERVSEYYYRNVFRKRFVNNGDDTERQLYQNSIANRKAKHDDRTEDLARTYQWVHPDMSRSQIMRDPTFKALARKANYWSAMQASFTPDYVHDIGMIMSETLSLEDVSNEQLTEALRNKVGSDEEYMEVMKLLGRKLPDDDTPIGNSPDAYLAAVFAYYMAKHNGRDWSEDDEDE